MSRRPNSAKMAASSLILEIGEAYTKLGFSVEPSPRAIIPTSLPYSLSQGLAPPSKEQWEAAIKKFLRFLYAEKIRVNPADRKVVVVEGPYWTLAFKQALASTLFGLKVPAVRFLPGISLPIYITAKDSGLIVDVGFAETRVLPLVDGFPIMSAMQSAPVGMSHVHAKFVGECKGVQGLSRSQVEDLVLRFCFVSAGPGNGDVKQVPLPGGAVLELPYAVRAAAADVLFGAGEEGYSVAGLVTACLRACSIDARASVARNVVVCGGTSMLPGFRRRLLTETDRLLEGEPMLRGLKGKLQLVESAVPANIQHFVGASLVVSLNEEGLITAADVKDGVVPIPDWSTQSLVALASVAQEDVHVEEDEYVF